MNFGSAPKIPAPPSIPQPSTAPTHLGQEVGSGPAQGIVGIGAPQHFDPNNPSVRLDGTVHNPTGVGGDVKLSREVTANDLKNLPVPKVHAPDLSLPSGSFGSGGSDGGGFSMPSLGNPMSGLGLPDFPSVPSMPSMPSLPDLPSIGNPFSGISSPDLSLPSMPDFGNPFRGRSGSGLSLPDLPSVGTPGMPGFRFLELPDLPDLDLDLSEWDLLPSFGIPDWEGDSESERQKPDARAKKTEKVQVEIRLETEEGVGVPGACFRIQGKGGFQEHGTLDHEGRASKEIPRGEYRIEYPDSAYISCAILAARLHRALSENSIPRLTRCLLSPPESLRKAAEIYATRFSRGRSTMAADIRSFCSGKPEEMGIHRLLCDAELDHSLICKN